MKNLLISLVFLAAVTAHAQCRPTSGTGQQVCMVGSMEQPVDGRYWHKRQGVNRPLVIFVSNEVNGVQNTTYVGRVAAGHLYKEVRCLNGICDRPVSVIVDDNDVVVSRD